MHKMEISEPPEFEYSGVPVRRCCRTLQGSWRIFVFTLAPLLLLPIPLIIRTKEANAGYVVCLMAVYWLTETVPLPITALLPVVLYPMFGIASSSEICINYMKEVMMMTLGSLMLGVAMEHHNAHKRLALKSLLIIGTSHRRLLLGFLATAAFLSMITTNAATASMMIPVVKAVVEELQDSTDLHDRKNSYPSEKMDDQLKTFIFHNKESKRQKRFQIGLLLCVAYGTSIGGTGTLTGAAPNLILMALVEQDYPDYTKLSFGSWMLFSLPGVVLAVLSSWVVLQIFFVKCSNENEEKELQERVKEIISRKYKELGPATFAEKVIALLFFLLLLLWFFRDPNFMAGWASLLSVGRKKIENATPAMAVALLLFVIPSTPSFSGRPILDWKTTHEMVPWSIMLLLGGGLALADGANKSGLMTWVAVHLAKLHFMPPLALVFTLCILTLAITEITSNTSTASLLLPVLGKLAAVLEVHPLYLMLPVTICCSYAFMLPMATSPNALVYQNSDMKTRDMAFPGIFLNVIGCSIQVMMISFLGNFIFDFHTPIQPGIIISLNTTTVN